MHWIAASLVSALFLGVYELCTKHAVRDNAVVPVLFFSTLCGAAVWIALVGTEAADLILKGLNGAIGSKRVTYDFARQMDGATEIKCSEFGSNIISHM